MIRLWATATSHLVTDKALHRVDQSRLISAAQEGLKFMVDRPAFEHRDDGTRLDAFLDLIAKDMSASSLHSELPSDFTSLAKTRDLSLVDISEMITGPVDL